MPYVYTEEDPTVLCHYGRIGMKWYQHIFGDDPRWGRHGRAKGADGDGELKTTSEEEAKKPLTAKQHQKNVRNIYKLSDEELKKATERLKAQKEYKELVDSQTRQGQSALKRALKKVGDAALEGLGYGSASVTAKKLADYLAKKQPEGGYSTAEQILRMTADYLKGKTVPKKK